MNNADECSKQIRRATIMLVMAPVLARFLSRSLIDFCGVQRLFNSSRLGRLSCRLRCTSSVCPAWRRSKIPRGVCRTWPGVLIGSGLPLSKDWRILSWSAITWIIEGLLEHKDYLVEVSHCQEDISCVFLAAEHLWQDLGEDYGDISVDAWLESRCSEDGGREVILNEVIGSA